MSRRVAIVHDWLTSMRGGERVLEVLCSLFPQADLFALTRDPAHLSPALAQRGATTSPIQRIASAPFVNGRFRALLPFFPLCVESFNLDAYDLVLSSSHCVAMGAIASPTALHVAYVHSTLRYVREAQSTYEASVPCGPVGRALFHGAADYLRRWETVAATRPHVLIANSVYTRERILRYHRRDAVVIEPPIETRRFERAAEGEPRPASDGPFLLVSALVPSKRVDLALRAFHGRPERLVVVGEGPERGRLERWVGPNVTMLSRLGEGELARLFAHCRALLHTGVDDFGMVMVEALSAGIPVLACAEGGALEIVRDGDTGLLIAAPTVDSVRAALDRFSGCSDAFDPVALRAFARRFDRQQFERRFMDVVDDAWRKHQCGRNGLHEINGLNGKSGLHTNVDPSPVSPALAGRSRVGAAAKRFIDVALAASGLVLTAPLVAGLAAWIRLDSEGPALFRQRRHGLHQRPFTLVKLRTMDHGGRVTRAGQILRPLGLDELPQLWNVLRGDMSLIGPRPEVLERAVRYEFRIPGYPDRHLVRPGITGWAQVNGMRGDAAPIGERLRFDIEYLREWSLAMDGQILARTVPAVLGDALRALRS
jgi:lipopolysaccharide/colanic/teichoic acid biosynthesis glycosyltransferase/glycosyltransferase involved in cell wall biosynthesis